MPMVRCNFSAHHAFTFKRENKRPIECSHSLHRFKWIAYAICMSKEVPNSITPAVFQKTMLLLAEKRTAMTTLRTGAAISLIPLSILSFLVAMMDKLELQADPVLLGFTLACNAVLAVFGLYLIRRGLVRMRFHDRKLDELKAQYPELRELFYQ